MTDKARRTAPLAITCSDGEQPTAAKVSAINNQLRVATNTLEKIVGDPWNQAGDSLLYTYYLQIPNLARMLGQNKYLNPCLYPVDEDFVYVDDIGTKHNNENDFYLQFKPKDGTSITVDAGSVLTNAETNKYDVDASGDYYVDGDTGRLVSFDEIDTDDEVSYTVDSSEWNTRTDTLPGVIPDPRQADFISCRISTSASKYYIHLPPRLPLSYDHDGGSFDGWSLPDRYPPSAEWSKNYDTSIAATGGKKLWQDPTYAALADAFYRYSLPKEMKDQISSMTEGDTLPQGFLWLWDKNTGTIASDVIFKRGPDSTKEWVFEVTSDTIDFSGKATTTEDEVSYNGTGYVVIAVGSPVARSLWTLSNALVNHTHGNDGDFSSPMEHSKLINLNPPPSDYSGHSSRYPTDVPAWIPSRWEHDDHISLLSRAGSQGTADGRNRDVNDNAMLGDFLLASTTASGGNYLNNTADSNRIYFGQVLSTAAPSLYFSQSNNVITAVAIQSGNTNGFRGEGCGTGSGLVGIGDDSGVSIGVSGSSESSIGIGVKGTTEENSGVYGESTGTVGIGVFAGASSSGKALYAWNTGTGWGAHLRSAASYAAYLEVDSIFWAPLHIDTQASDPVSAAEGDIYVNHTSHHIYCYLDGSWTQLD